MTAGRIGSIATAASADSDVAIVLDAPEVLRWVVQ